jgi:hypothetical protein
MNPRFFSGEETVSLVPVIEMMPTDYALTDRPLPSGATKDEYSRYWSACLTDSGIEGLQPIGLRHIPIRQLTDAHTLKRVVHQHRFENASDDTEEVLDRFSDPDEYLSAFPGGYALMVNERVVCTPRCCGDLADISSWQEAADYRGMHWTEVWIGHPGIQVRFDGTQLILRDHDDAGDGRTEWDDEVSIRPEALHSAVGQAGQELQEFFRRLLPVVERLGPLGQAIPITEILTASVRPSK